MEIIKEDFKMNKDMELFDKLIDTRIDGEEDLNKLESIFKEYNVNQFKIDNNCAFDSTGLDVYYYAVSYIYEGELEMFTGTYEYC